MPRLHTMSIRVEAIERASFETRPGYEPHGEVGHFILRLSGAELLPPRSGWEALIRYLNTAGYGNVTQASLMPAERNVRTRPLVVQGFPLALEAELGAIIQAFLDQLPHN